MDGGKAMREAGSSCLMATQPIFTLLCALRTKGKVAHGADRFIIRSLNT